MGQAEIQEAARPSTQSDTLDSPDFSPCTSAIRLLADGRTAWLHDGSCMSRETHVQLCESLRVRFPGATHRNIYVRSQRAGQRVMTNVTCFLTRRLKLKVNEVKSAVARPVDTFEQRAPVRRLRPASSIPCHTRSVFRSLCPDTRHSPTRCGHSFAQS